LVGGVVEEEEKRCGVGLGFVRFSSSSSSSVLFGNGDYSEFEQLERCIQGYVF
jgi:hypothetical protein